MPDPRDELLQPLKAYLETVSRYTAETLAEGRELGAMNFRAGESTFHTGIAFSKELLSLPLSELPGPTLKKVHDAVKRFAETLQQIAGFSLVGKSDPQRERDGLLKRIPEDLDHARDTSLVCFPYLWFKSTDIPELEGTLRNTVETITQKETEVDSIVEAARDAAAQTGVVKFAVLFQEEAKKHDRASKRWLLCTTVFTMATVSSAILLPWLLPAEGDLKSAQTVQGITSKLVALSILYVATLWSARNYRAHRHNAVVNDHRQNALATFQTFAESSSDEQTKNAVLLEATRCVFSSSVTGYLSSKGETGGDSRVVEVIKSVGKPPV